MAEILDAKDPAAIGRAAHVLRAGGLVAFPTETVYGLGADATNGEAVARIYEAKGRPRFNPLISHVADYEAACRLGHLDARAVALAEAFWPGPLTLVVPRAPACPVADLVTAGLDTVAIRVPAHGVAQALLRAVDRPLAAPSANPSGRVSPTTAAHVAEGLGDAVGLILDGGPCTVGVESTIVGFAEPGEPPRLLRPGGLPRAAIEEIVGELRGHGHTITAPGQLDSHYAPAAHLRLNAAGPRKGEALLAFGPDVPRAAARVLNLSPAGDLREAAANLFAFLRALDAEGHARIAVMPVPDEGLGEAINDRLARAAAPRTQPTAT